MAGAILEILEQTPRRTGWMADPELEVPEELRDAKRSFGLPTRIASRKCCMATRLQRSEWPANLTVLGVPGTFAYGCNGLRRRSSREGMWAIRHIPGSRIGRRTT